ncbi:MAG: hypothetical protein ACJA2G_003125 [Cognaticolwellia sp.]|jgi:hypothetical protein
MARPRQTIVNLDDTPYYHCCSRVVRKAFLCGFDNSTGENFEHRREWVDARNLELATTFAIDICAYAVLRGYSLTCCNLPVGQSP